MEELLHIPYGACIINADGELKNKMFFTENISSSSLSDFYRLFEKMSDSDVAYFYFLTVDSADFSVVQPGTVHGCFPSENKKDVLSSVYAQYGIYAYSLAKNLPIHSFRIKDLTKKSIYAFSILHYLYTNAVAPSHITEVLESINEKTPA